MHDTLAAHVDDHRASAIADHPARRRPWLVRESAAGEVHPTLHAWRRQATNALLPGIALVVFPMIFDAIVNNPFALGMPGRVAVGAGYTAIGGLAVGRRLDERVRIWGVLLLIFMLSAFGIARSGAGGIGAFLLLGLPVLALVLLDARAGWITTALSLSTYVLLAAGSYAGVLARWHGPQAWPAQASDWALQGLALSIMLIPIIVLLDRLLGLHATLLANEKAALAELKQEADERRHLECRLADAATTERQNLGRELHDSVCQQTAGAQLRVSVLASRAENVDAKLAADLRGIADLLREASSDAKRMSRGLYPDWIPDRTLQDSLRSLATTTMAVHEVSCAFMDDGSRPPLHPDASFHLFKIAHEAVSNAVRHGHPTRITIEQRRVSAGWEIRVQDDGSGFDSAVQPGLGLRIMTHRAMLIGASLSAGPAPGGGSLVICTIPGATATGPNEVTSA